MPRTSGRRKPAAETGHPLASKDMGSLADRILYMDKQVIVIDKPPGLATQGGSGLTKHVDGMLDSLQYEKPTRPKLVHRLDRDTSGVLLVARTAQAASGLSPAWRCAIPPRSIGPWCAACPSRSMAWSRAALVKEGGHGPRGRDERMTVSEDDEAKFALTEYAVMGTAGQEFAWVAARPITGRTHQIRVHMASLGTPIVGDFKYGGTDARAKGEIADKLHLHARSIDIGRPDGGRLQATAPLPPHMLKSWKLLGFDPDDRSDPFPPKKKRRMKRFYKEVAVAPADGGFAVLLDGRPVKPPPATRSLCRRKIWPPPSPRNGAGRARRSSPPPCRCCAWPTA